MGILGAIIGGLIGTAIGGPLGGLIGAGLGSGLGDSDDTPSHISLKCLHCGKTFLLPPPPASANIVDLLCPHCEKPLFIVRCPSCAERTIVSNAGSYACATCSKPFHVALCLTCRRSLLIVGRRNSKCQICGDHLWYRIPYDEAQTALIVLAGQVGLACLAASADGHFDPKERGTILRFYTDLGFSADSLGLIESLIRQFHDHRPTLEGLCHELSALLPPGDRMIVLDLLLQVIRADGRLHDSETAFFRRAAEALGIPAHIAAALLASASATSDLEAAYAILELPPDCSDEDLKTRYRALVRQHHPDKFEHQGPQVAEAARLRFLEIQKAYETVTAHRAAGGR